MTRNGWCFLGCSFIAALVLSVCSANAKPEKDPTLKEIMARLHKGDNAVRPMIDKDLAEDKIDWADVQKLTKEYLDGAKSVATKDPPMGSKDSWQKFTKSYISAADQLNSAAKDKDKDKTLDAHKNLVKGCADCHQAHRPKEKGSGS
jgi:cytochrome c556